MLKLIPFNKKIKIYDKKVKVEYKVLNLKNYIKIMSTKVCINKKQILILIGDEVYPYYDDRTIYFNTNYPYLYRYEWCSMPKSNMLGAIEEFNKINHICDNRLCNKCLNNARKIINF